MLSQIMNNTFSANAVVVPVKKKMAPVAKTVVADMTGFASTRTNCFDVVRNDKVISCKYRPIYFKLFRHIDDSPGDFEMTCLCGVRMVLNDRASHFVCAGHGALQPQCACPLKVSVPAAQRMGKALTTNINNAEKVMAYCYVPLIYCKGDGGAALDYDPNDVSYCLDFWTYRFGNPIRASCGFGCKACMGLCLTDKRLESVNDFDNIALWQPAKYQERFRKFQKSGAGINEPKIIITHLLTKDNKAPVLNEPSMVEKEKLKADLAELSRSVEGVIAHASAVLMSNKSSSTPGGGEDGVDNGNGTAATTSTVGGRKRKAPAVPKAPKKSVASGGGRKKAPAAAVMLSSNQPSPTQVVLPTGKFNKKQKQVITELCNGDVFIPKGTTAADINNLINGIEDVSNSGSSEDDYDSAATSDDDETAKAVKTIT